MIYRNFLNEEQLSAVEEISKNIKVDDASLTANALAKYVKGLKNVQYGSGQFDRILFGPMNPESKQWIHNYLGDFKTEGLQLLIYDVGDEYGWHTDEPVTPMGNRTMNIQLTVFLNDDYEGGELEAQTEFGTQNLTGKRGDISLIPIGYLHRVKKVTKGKRKVLVGWADCAVKSASDRFIIYSGKEIMEELREYSTNLTGEDKEKFIDISIRLYNILMKFKSNSIKS